MEFSVVICTYNAGHMLGDALESVARQTFRDYEVILIDDGSTDDTERVAEEFRPKLPRLRFLPQTHSGLALSRNAGVSHAAGELIAFLDADDLWCTSYLARMRSALSRNPEMHGAYSNGSVILNSGKVIRPFFPASPSAIAGRIQTSAALFSFFPSVTPSAFVVRRSAFGSVGLYDTRLHNYGQDWHWLIRAVRQGLDFYRVEEKLVLYRLHGSNLTRHGAAMFEAWLNIYRETLKGTAFDSKQETYVREFTRARVPALLGSNSAARARDLLRRALDEFPGDLLLRLAWASTFLGGPYLLRFLRAFRRRILGMNPARRELPASPAVFDLLRSMP
jgi:glycosyltransferase involved in cell wall biosynthesis